MEKWYLYIIRSEKDKRLYVGISKDVEKRLVQHNSGKTFSTRSRRPLKLIYSEEHDNLKQARDREKYLKSYAGAEEKRKLANHTGE
jgi:putative endonuclease